MRRLALLLGLLIALTGVGLHAAPPAAAARLVNATPADGSRLDRGPSNIVLTFDADLIGGILEVVPDGRTLNLSQQPQTNGKNITQPMPPQLPAGRYTIKYTAVTANNESISGQVSFSVVNPGPPVALPTSLPPEDAPSSTSTKPGRSTSTTTSASASTTAPTSSTTTTALPTGPTTASPTGAQSDRAAPEDDAIPAWVILLAALLVVAFILLTLVGIKHRIDRGERGASGDARDDEDPA